MKNYELVILVKEIKELELGIITLSDSKWFEDTEVEVQLASVADVDSCLDWLREEKYGFEITNDELIQKLTETEAEKVKGYLEDVVERLEKDLEDIKYNC